MNIHVSHKPWYCRSPAYWADDTLRDK